MPLLGKSVQEPCSLVQGRNRASPLLYRLVQLTSACPRFGTDPLVHHGRHFGRTVHALCNISTLMNNGMLRMGELADQSDDIFTHEYVFNYSSERTLIVPCTRERREHRIFQQLLQMIPGLEDRL